MIPLKQFFSVFYEDSSIFENMHFSCLEMLTELRFEGLQNMREKF